MINLDYLGNTASVILRLRQITELSNPYYLFDIKNKNTEIHTYFTADDISLAPGLYQEFAWRNNSIAGLTQGNFIENIGEYLVTIYDTQYQYNLDIASASSILMYETMRIHGPELPTINSYSATDNMTFSYYSGGNGN